MIKHILIIITFLSQLIYSQNNIQQVLVGGVAHIGNGQVIQNATVIISNGKIINKSRLAIIQALAIVIKNGMSILGVSTPKSM